MSGATIALISAGSALIGGVLGALLSSWFQYRFKAKERKQIRRETQGRDLTQGVQEWMSKKNDESIQDILSFPQRSI